MKYLKELKTINDLSKLKDVVDKDLVPAPANTKYTLEELNNMLNQYRPYVKIGMTYSEIKKIKEAENQSFRLDDLEVFKKNDPEFYKIYEKLHHIIMFGIIENIKNIFVKLYEELDFSGNFLDYDKFKQDLNPILKKKMELRKFLEPLMKGQLDISFFIADNEIRVFVYNMNWETGEGPSNDYVQLDNFVVLYEDLISEEEKDAKKFGI